MIFEYDENLYKILTQKFEDTYQWDKKNSKQCGWDDRDLTMIAEGLRQASQCILNVLYNTNDKYIN